MRRIVSCILVFAILLAWVPQVGIVSFAQEALDVAVASDGAVEYGTFGDNLSWTLDGNGVLTISGTGEMPWYTHDYYTDNLAIRTPPWYSCADQVREVVVQNGVTSIGSYAFYYCNGLKKATIADSVKRIEEGIFYHCYSLQSVNYTATMAQWKEIEIEEGNGEIIFNGVSCTDGSIEAGEITGACGDNAVWGLKNTGVLTISGTGDMKDYYYSSINEMMEWEGYKDRVTEVVVKEGITSIGNWAFYKHENLKKVTIESSVLSVGYSAFYDCSALEQAYYNGTKAQWDSVSVGSDNNQLIACLECTDGEYELSGTCGDSVTWVLSQNGVLTISGTGEMTDYYYSSGSSSVPWGDYRNQVTEVVIEEGVTTIGRSAFTAHYQLTRITIPSTVSFIGSYAFYNCENLVDVQYNGTVDDWKKISFEEYNMIIIAGTKCTDGVVELTGTGSDGLQWKLGADQVLTISGTGAMMDYYYSVSLVPWYAYRSAIRKVVVESGVTSVGYNAFYDCDRLTQVELADTVTGIGYFSFYDCDRLVQITIPNCVTQIGESAFYSCDMLNSVTFGGALEQIGDYAFRNCECLQTVSYGATVAQWGSVVIGQYNTALQRIMISCTDGQYDPYMTGSCGEQVSWTLTASGLLTISGTGAMTDYYMSSVGSTAPWYHEQDRVEKIVVSSGVTTVGEFSFYRCGNLKEVRLPKTLTKVGSYAFYGCYGLSDVYYGGSLTDWENVTVASNNEPLLNTTLHTDAVLLTAISVTAAPGKSEYQLGEELDLGGMELTGFYDNGSQQQITEGFTVSGFDSETVGSKTVTVSFEGFTATFTVEVVNNSVIASGTCGNGLRWVLGIDSVLTISGTGAMEDYDFDNMPWYDYQSVIEKIMICEGVTRIGTSAFDSCAKVTEVTIAETVTEIGAGAFYSCKLLAEIVIPDNVCSVGDEAFYRCTGLKTVWIGKGMETIGGYAFSGCKAITEVYYNSTEKRWNQITVEGGNTPITEATLHVLEDEEGAIVEQPAPASAQSGENVQFHVSTEGKVLSYKWEYRKLYKWFNTSQTGYNTDTLTVAATGQRNGYDYRCLVTFADGTQLYSEPAELTVITYITDVISPNDQTVVLGYKGQFTASAVGESVKYQWQYKRPGSDLWIDTAMEGATKATVMIETTTARNGYQYRCKITDITGNVAFTEAATMRVLSFSGHPEEAFAPIGGKATFIVSTSTDSGFTYQWQYSRNHGETWSNTTMTGYNTATLTVSATAARSGYLYRCVLTGSKNSTIVSKTAQLHVSEPLEIVSQPESRTAAAGRTVSFTVEANNVRAYQWYYSKNGTTWYATTMTGATTETLRVSVTSGRNGYRYRCLLYGMDGTEVYTETAILTVG